MKSKWAKAALLLTVGLTCGSLPADDRPHVSGAPAAGAGLTPEPLAATNPAPPKLTEWSNKGVRLGYPSDWRAKKNPDYELMILPPGVGSDDRRITLDIPDLPPHLAWMIQMSRVEHDYLQDLKKSHPDLKEESAADARVPNSKARLIRSSWHQNGKAYADVVLLIIHDGAVYILDAQTDAENLDATRSAFDLIQSSLRWGK